MRPILAVLKKNILSVICGVVALAAVIAIFWPIDGYFADLQQQVDARKGPYATGVGLLHKSRNLPVLDPLSTDPVPLKIFPTEAVIARGKLAQDGIASESKQMLDSASKLVIHQPLVPNALPNGGNMDAIFFLRKYQQVMTYPTVDPDQLQYTLPITILHASAPPSDTEIQARQAAVKDEITQERTLKDSQGNPINGPEVEEAVETAVDAVPGEMRSVAATQNQMYIAPGAFHIYPGLTGVNPPSTVAMFNGQMGLWLLQDVFSAIASANADKTGGVPNSRIKNLIKIDYSDELFKPVYSLDPSAAPAVADPLHPPRMLNQSATGHVSNGLYDVVPFSLQLVVDAQDLPEVLESLSRNRFITVLNMSLSTVDSGQAVLGGFLYGDKPVVMISLSCEELFFRSDTRAYMPDSIQRALGIPPPQAPGAAPGAPPVAG